MVTGQTGEPGPLVHEVVEGGTGEGTGHALNPVLVMEAGIAVAATL